MIVFHGCNSCCKATAAVDVPLNIVMGMEKHFLQELKKIYAPMISVSDEVYEKLLPFLQLRHYPEKKILKDIGEIEVTARLILDGVICQYQLDKNNMKRATKIFLPGQNPMDMESYIDQVPTDTLFQTKTKVRVIELAKECEEELLKKVPEVMPLAVKINHQLIKYFQKWEQLTNLPKIEAYHNLISLYPNLGNILKVRDIQDLLGMSKTSLNRIRTSK